MSRGDVMVARGIVERFVVALGRILEAVQLHFDLIGRRGNPGSLVGLAKTGEVSRSGRIPGMGEFEFHGAGCRFLLDTGEEIDVDWDAAGNAVFDTWRLRIYAESIGFNGVSDKDLTDACGALRETDVLVETRPGWFADAGGIRGE